MTIYSQFKSRYIYLFILFLGFVFFIRDYVFTLNSSREFDWYLYLFSVFSDQLFWLILVPLFYRIYESYPLKKGSVKTSIIKLIPYMLGLATFHRLLTVVLGKYLEHKLNIISDDTYERIQNFYVALISGGIVNDLIFLSVLICIISFIEYYENFKSEQLKNLQVTDMLNEAKLSTLRMQMQPHFLFNSLNTVSATMEENIETAQNIVSKLASFLRYSLEYQSQKTVPLHEEVQFTKYYLDIELERFSDRLKIDYDIDPKTIDILVPSFILQPFVENSIKHGVNKDSNVTRLYICSKIENMNLLLEIGNNGSTLNNEITFGVGITNLTKRLTTIYENRFSISFDSKNGFRNILTIPIGEI